MEAGVTLREKCSIDVHSHNLPDLYLRLFYVVAWAKEGIGED